MRSLATLATLLLGLAVVFLAPTAKAHCPHGGDDIPEHCGGEPPPAPSHEFQFVGFTDVANFEDGDAEFAGMHAACQAEFPELGTQVRMCTSKEFLLSPVQEAPDVPAWVHPVRDFFPVVTTNFVISSCILWTTTAEDVRGLVVGTDGKVSIKDAGGADILCNVARPVTCCAQI